MDLRLIYQRRRIEYYMGLASAGDFPHRKFLGRLVFVTKLITTKRN
ncbi:unnamed protein product [Tenebrio molitor]|nr:unnamed protein product [Tenebrio molitor]